MASSGFSKGEAIRFGWGAMTAHFGSFFVILIVGLLIELTPGVLQWFALEEAGNEALVGVLAVTGLLFQLIVDMGLTAVSLKPVDNVRPRLGDLFSRIHLFFKYLGGMIVYILIVVGGLILLIVPGIVWALKFQFFSYFIIDKEMGPMEALKQSAAITQGAKWNLFLFVLVLAVLNFLGSLPLLVGLLATIPTTMVAVAFVYRKLLAQAEAAQAGAAQAISK